MDHMVFRAHMTATNAVGQAKLLASSIRSLAKIADLVPQKDRAELIEALDELTHATGARRSAR
jgi:hypothetical protein